MDNIIIYMPSIDDIFEKDSYLKDHLLKADTVILCLMFYHEPVFLSLAKRSAAVMKSFIELAWQL